MRRLVADTDVVSYIFKWHPSAPRYVQLLESNEVMLSFVTPAEMRLGALKARWGLRKRNLLEGYLSRFAVCYPDDQLCTRWAEVKHESNRKGQPIGSHDAWIAASVLYLDAPLVTNNAKHYAHLAKLQILTREG
jgi:predicted nucleic acid-binding protein